MRNVVSRRRFVHSALAAGALTKISASANSRAHIKVGLYSITYGGVWYRGDALSVEQVIGRAKNSSVPKNISNPNPTPQLGLRG